MPLSAICAGWLADSLMRGRDTASVCSDPFLSEVGTRSSGGGHVASKLMPEEAVCVQAAELAEAGSEAEAEVDAVADAGGAAAEAAGGEDAADKAAASWSGTRLGLWGEARLGVACGDAKARDAGCGGCLRLRDSSSGKLTRKSPRGTRAGEAGRRGGR